MRFAIVGARLAGSYASLLLSRMGHEVLLFDHSIEREKPCGGGVTAKALGRMPWFHERSLPHTKIHRLRLVSPEGSEADLSLGHPIQIYSRATLDTSLRESSSRAGTRFICERATGLTRCNGSWVVATPEGEYEADYLVGADGATSTVRARVSQKFQAGDLSLALGYYLPGIYHQDTVIAQFQENGFEGYLWSFPRVDHSSVGILRWLPSARSGALRKRVEDFIESRYPGSGRDKVFYAARIPCLSRARLIHQRVCGDQWALIGDSAGFADAITAEGIYFALRSAELFAESVRHGQPASYEWRWRKDFGAELLRAAAWKDRFYGGRFLLQSFTSRAVQAVRCSSTIRRLSDRMIAGHTGYEALKRQLIFLSPRILIEAALHFVRLPDRADTPVGKRGADPPSGSQRLLDDKNRGLADQHEVLP